MQDGLIEYIEKEIIPRYAEFDAAHKENHARSVIAQSQKLARYYDVKPELLYAAAAYHDLGLCRGREHHHMESGKIIRGDAMLRKWFSEDEIEIIAQAAEDHRASNENPPRSIYGRIIAESDRLIDPGTVLRRTVQYGFSRYPEMSRKQMWDRALSHLNAKYAEGGYLKLWIPESDNAARLAELRRIISDKKELRRRFDELYRMEEYGPAISPRFLNEEKYRTGHCRIINAKPGTEIMGLHTPEMKAFAKEMAQRKDWRESLHDLEDNFMSSPLSHEEISIWGLCIDYVKCNIKERLELFWRFLPAIDNWANCDTVCCNAKWAGKADAEDAVWAFILKCLAADGEFTRRTGIILTLCYFLDDRHIDRSLHALMSMHLQPEEPYYVQMGVAWLLATALAKHPDKTRSFVSSADSGIPQDIIKMYVRKARESFITRNTAALKH